jgi:predicted DNA-binding transcriptional regulator AlpA
MSAGTMPAAMNDRELAQRLGISRKTLQKWRSLGMGPPYLKLGAKVVYRAEDIEAYIQHCLRQHK